ncbi:MAG: hypothetical protein WCY93_07340 [Anaerolineaceae bacterium]
MRNVKTVSTYKVGGLTVEWNEIVEAKVRWKFDKSMMEFLEPLLQELDTGERDRGEDQQVPEFKSVRTNLEDISPVRKVFMVDIPDITEEEVASYLSHPLPHMEIGGQTANVGSLGSNPFEYQAPISYTAASAKDRAVKRIENEFDKTKETAEAIKIPNENTPPLNQNKSLFRASSRDTFSVKVQGQDYIVLPLFDVNKETLEPYVHFQYRKPGSLELSNPLATILPLGVSQTLSESGQEAIIKILETEIENIIGIADGDVKQLAASLLPPKKSEPT